MINRKSDVYYGIASVLLVVIVALDTFTPLVAMAVAWFGPYYQPRIEIIEQLLNNSVNYYNILCASGKPSLDLIAAYDTELRDMLKTLSTDRYLTPPFTDIERTGFNEFVNNNNLIEAKIKALKAKKLW